MIPLQLSQAISQQTTGIFAALASSSVASVALAGAIDAIEMEVAQVADTVQLDLNGLLLAKGDNVRHSHETLILLSCHFCDGRLNRGVERGNERDEVEGWGREAIKAVGDADFQWRSHASAAKSAQAAAAPGPLRCLGEAMRISRTACKAIHLL